MKNVALVDPYEAEWFSVAQAPSGGRDLIAKPNRHYHVVVHSPKR